MCAVLCATALPEHLAPEWVSLRWPARFGNRADRLTVSGQRSLLCLPITHTNSPGTFLARAECTKLVAIGWMRLTLTSSRVGCVGGVRCAVVDPGSDVLFIVVCTAIIEIGEVFFFAWAGIIVSV